MDEGRRLRQTLLKFNAIYPDGYPEGSVLMDAPSHNSVAELVSMAGQHGQGEHYKCGRLVCDLKAALVWAYGGS